MEKRLVIFLICSVLILTGHMLVTRVWFPPPPVVQQVPDDTDGQTPPGADGPQRSENTPSTAEQPEKSAAAPGASELTVGAAKPGEEPAERETPETGVRPTLPEVPLQWMTLGSYAPESPYQLLVTLTNQGASIERVELVARRSNGQLRYRDLERQFGYSGLQCRDTDQGCTVTVVGAGTPAAVALASDGSLPAGVLPGDVIETLDDVKIGSQTDLDSLLRGTRPEQTVRLGIRRRAGDTTSQRVFSFALADRPLELISPESLPGLPSIPSYLLGLNRVGAVTPPRGSDELPGLPSLRQVPWEVAEATADSVAFRYRLQVGTGNEAGEIEILKRFRIGANTPQDGDEPDALHSGYSVDMSIEMVNHGTSPQVISYALDGPNGLPTEGWWYSTKIHPAWGSAGARDVIWRVQGNRHSLLSASQIFKQAQKKDALDAMTSVLTDNPALNERTLDYLGVDTQYFSAVLMAGTLDAPRPFVCQQAYALPVGPLPELKGNEVKTLNSTFRLVSAEETVEPGKTATHDYHIFLGPKAPALLQEYQLADIIEYGWFGWIAKPLSKVLHLFYLIVRNYGLAIILLTVVVRGAMFPIGRKAARNCADDAGTGPRDQEAQGKVQERPGKTGPSTARTVEEAQLQSAGWLLADVSAIADFHRPVSLPVGGYRAASGGDVSRNPMVLEPGRPGHGLVLEGDSARLLWPVKPGGSGRI